MNTKLTLRIDERLVRSAKRYSRASGRSVSRLVADYLALIGQANPDDVELTPRVRGLVGALVGAGIDEEDHRHHLVEKHR